MENPNNLSPKINDGFICINCDYKCFNESIWKRHILTNKHKNLTNPNNLYQKINGLFECTKCEYTTSKNSEWKKHLLTIKHNNNNKNNKDISNNFLCECGKKYKHLSTLSSHKKICDINNKETFIDELNININQETFMTSIGQNIIEVLKQNSDFKELILEQNKIIMELSKSVGSLNSNNNINNNNKTFNIQMFLNETCKDALSMNEFIESLKITMEDVERFGTDGFIEGITKIFLKNLKMLDISKRPVHCSDLKREILYVKEDNTWQKDSEEKETMKKTIKKIAHKNFLRIQDWREENPEYKDPESKVNDKYQKIMFEAMGGYTKEEDEKNFAKIIRNVSKAVTINKNKS